MNLTYTEPEKKRLDVFLHEQYPDLSRSALQKFIKQEKVRVNNDSASVHHWLKPGDTITANAEPKKSSQPVQQEATVDPEIIAEEPEFVVLKKPAGLLTHPTEHNEPHTLASWLTHTFPEIASIGDPLRPGIVHRLDKDVGGIIIVAKTQRMYEYLKQQFRDRKIKKKYFALVYGQLEQNEGTIDTPITRSKETGKMIADSATEQGKAAKTNYTVLERFTHTTLLDVEIVTGRTHQIRTHLYSIGHSIVGDKLYVTRDLKKKKRLPLQLSKPFLYSYHLSFTDQSGQAHVYTIELPDRLKKILVK